MTDELQGQPIPKPPKQISTSVSVHGIVPEQIRIDQVASNIVTLRIGAAEMPEITAFLDVGQLGQYAHAFRRAAVQLERLEAERSLTQQMKDAS